MIKQGVKENKNVEKFDYVKQNRLNKQMIEQVPTSSNNTVNVFMNRNIRDNEQNERKETQKVGSNKSSGRRNDLIK